VLNAPWANARDQFVGWVPNVLGHLSFSLIGRGVTPDAICACAEFGGNQEVVAFQTRQADDGILHPLITRWTRPPSIHEWLLIAKSEAGSYPSSKNSPAHVPDLDIYDDPRGMLRGTINILVSKDWSESGFWGQFVQRWRAWRFRSTIIRTLRKLGRSDSAQTSPVADIESVLAAFQTSKTKNEGLEFRQIEFCLFRTGEARIWFKDENTFEDDGGRQIVAKIAYFFLKDIAHLHTHHHHSQDGMLPFCRLESHDSEGEKAWQRRTIWALSRSIEEYVRRGTRADLRAALGMIPYAESFHSLYGGLHRRPSQFGKFDRIEDHEFDHYSFESLRKMIASLLDARSSTLTARAALATAAIPITLSSIIAVNAVGTSETVEKLGKSVVRHPQWPAMIKDMAFAYPHAIVPSILVLMFAIYKIAYREAGQSEWFFTPARMVTRLIKATIVTLNRYIPFPPIAGYGIVLAAQAVAIWYSLRTAVALLTSIYP
jgi:hypothetical protein